MCVYMCVRACVCECVCSAAAQRLCCWASLLGLPHIFFKGAVRPQECHRGSGELGLWGGGGSLGGAAGVWVGGVGEEGGRALQCYSSPRSQRQKEEE